MAEVNQSQIDRYLSQILEAKRVASDPKNRGTDIEKQAWKTSNDARKALDELGYTGHSEGYMASGTSYDTAITGYLTDQWKKQGEELYNQQKAQIEGQAQAQINAIQRALEEAVAQGRISEQEAQRQFEANKEEINRLAYQDSQTTNLMVNDRGLSNSQQLLGFQAGDNARKNRNVTTARTARDARINEIKTRINQIKNQTNFDIANVNAQRDSALQSARSQIDAQLLGQISDFQMGNYHMDLQQRNALEQMDIQNQYTQENMAIQQGYTQDNMALQNQYTQSNMNLQHSLDLDKMKTQHGYDLEKMDTAFQQDLQKMAKQFGYDMKKIGTQHANQIAQINARKNAAIQEAQTQYELERQRLYDSHYDPTSQEYKIREAQINEAENQAITQLHQQALYSSLNEIMKPGSFGYVDWLNNPSKVIDMADVYLNNNTSGNHKKTMSAIELKGVPNLGR